MIEQRKPPVPTKQEIVQKQPDIAGKNYLKENKQQAIEAKPKRQMSLKEETQKHKEHGKVPE